MDAKRTAAPKSELKLEAEEAFDRAGNAENVLEK
jgi:hypothetical protein